MRSIEDQGLILIAVVFGGASVGMSAWLLWDIVRGWIDRKGQ